MSIARRKVSARSWSRRGREAGRLLGLVGAFDDAPEFADVLDAIVKARRGEGRRTVSSLSQRTPGRRGSLSSRA